MKSNEVRDKPKNKQNKMVFEWWDFYIGKINTP